MKRIIDASVEFVPLVVLFFMLTAGLWLTADDFPSQSLCIFKRIFLLDCPGCGLTHAFLLIPRGHWVAATRYNLAAVPLYFLFLVIFLRMAAQKLKILQLPFMLPRSVMFYVTQGTVFLLVVGWIYKIGVYFSEHSLKEYASHLIACLVSTASL